MANKLFVAGLSYDITDDQLQNHFAQAGTVTSAKVITDKFTGKSRGFGFVEMSTDEEAAEAMKQFDNTEFEGRTINVKEARPMEERPQRNFGGGNDRGGRRDDNRGDRW